MAKVIGIDLGTTNSCVAIIEAGQPIEILAIFHFYRQDDSENRSITTITRIKI